MLSAALGATIISREIVRVSTAGHSRMQQVQFKPLFHQWPEIISWFHALSQKHQGIPLDRTQLASLRHNDTIIIIIIIVVVVVVVVDVIAM